jgi:uncharacterized integral membrane protein
VRREGDDPNDAVPEGRGLGEYRREGLGGKAISLIVVGVLLLIFTLQNLEDANVDFLFWEWDIAIGAVILVAAVLGFVLGWGFAWMRRRARRERRQERRED